MSTEIRAEIDRLIEDQLQEYAATLHATETTIQLLGRVIEGAFTDRKIAAGQYFRASIEILAEELVARGITSEKLPFGEDEVRHIVVAIEYGVKYYQLRDLIYISHAVPEAITWSRGDTGYNIAVKDPTIFRQIVCEMQSFVLNTRAETPGLLGADETIDHLRGSQRWDVGDPRVKAVLDSIEKEVDWKLSYYSSDIPKDSLIDVGGYTYKDFILVYGGLLFLSLYERYYSAATDDPCAITYHDAELLEAVHKETLVSKENISRILMEIAASSKGSLIRIEDGNKYLLLPFCFSMSDGVNAYLKYMARVRSTEFLTNVAGILGDSLVTQVAGYFREYRNFKVLTNIPLRRFGAHLPDIDVMAISYEPSLGFHFFICEIKNNLAASWAKEYLKSVGKKGFMEKAIAQVDAIREFFKAAEGHDLLIGCALREFSHLDLRTLFPVGFVNVFEYLIVTSQSIGMFFPNAKVTIINKDLFHKMVKHSDGDVNYIKFCLQRINEAVDSSFSVKKTSATARGVTIEFEAPVIESGLQFIENSYLSTQELEQLEKMSLTEGYRFIDQFIEGDGHGPTSSAEGGDNND